MQATDLIYPQGELLPIMFPDGDLQSSVAVWLTEAQAATGDETAQRHWAYYRAYAAVANRIASLPSSENSFGTHSVTWGSERIARFQEQSEAHLTEYNRLTGSDTLNSKKPAGFKVY